MNPHHDRQFLRSRIQFRPRNIEVKAVFGDTRDIAQCEWNIPLAVGLRTSWARGCRIVRRTGDWNERSRRFESIRAAGILAVLDVEKDLNTIPLEALIPDIIVRIGRYDTGMH